MEINDYLLCLLCCAESLCPVRLFVTSWTVARQTPLHGDSLGKNTRVDCHALLQGIFPTQGSNPDLPHYRLILYRLGQQGSLRILEWVAYPFSVSS